MDILLCLIILILGQGVSGATFTFTNKCDFTVWPGILAGAGSPKLDTTGFELPKATSHSFQAPTGWSGRFWGRTGCNFDSSSAGSCTTGDCGSGEVECNGSGATPPATLAEFTLGSGSLDFYDVSLVDGYNIPMVIEGIRGSGSCGSTGCLSDLNRMCPMELKTEGGEGCKSACEAFGTAEYCCSGEYNSPATCKPSIYSQIFKSACPKSYSYAYDDATSTFTCSGADYTVTFCPSFPSLKSSSDSSANATSDDKPSMQGSGSETEPIGEATLANSWLANLATGVGGSTRSRGHPNSFVFQSATTLAISLIFPFLYL